MRLINRLATITMALGALLGLTSSAHAYVYSSDANFGSYTSGSYIVYNDNYAGPSTNQWLNVNSPSSWNVSSNFTGGGVKAYGNVSTIINKSLSSMKSCTSNFNTSTGSGAFDNSYDIWSDGDVDEVMLWENWSGAVGPIGSEIASNVSAGGSTWNVYRGNTGHNVVSLLRTSQTHSGSVDILAVFKYLNSKGWLSSASIYQLQFGFELTSTSSWQTFTCNSYSVSHS